VSRTEVTLESILGMLPDLDELEVLRLRLVSAALPDPGRAWDSSSAYATIDKHLVSAEAADRAVDEAREALQQFTDLLHRGLRPVLHAFYEGDPAAAARALVALGEEMEGAGRAQGARQCYRTALAVSLPLAEKGAQILALRRIGRVSMNVGEFLEASSCYERSAELARDSGDLHGEVIARTGLGNVRMWQGRWSEAERPYLEAMSLADSFPDMPALERGHLYNNLGNLYTRLGRLDEAEAWFERAFRLWKDLHSPVDLATCHFNHAQLREAQGRWEEAQLDYEAALAQPIHAALRAGIATDYAEWWLHAGHVTRAEEWGRVAEQQAIAARSPYTLGRMYHGRGNIARARGDLDGFTFYEKALEIAREKGYPYLEGETLRDYARLRADNGGAEEAVAYLERARDIFRDLGALGQFDEAERALAALAPAAAAAIVEFPAARTLPEEPEPPRMAATGD
jgi:tetratricopeptide (TPR) repeat protein